MLGKITTIVIIYYLTNRISNLSVINQIISSLGSFVIIAWISWQAGAHLYKRLLSTKIYPKVNPDNKAVLITGCDTGLGREYVLSMNKYGFYVFATVKDLNLDQDKDLISKCDNPSKVKVIKMDVTKIEEIKDAKDNISRYCRDNNLQLYGLINNAGVGPTSPFEFSNLDYDCDLTFKVNVLGLIKVTKEFLPLIRKSSPGSRIINISSLAGREGMPHNVFYCSSKAAITSLSKTIRRELDRFQVHVINIQPYFFKTNLTNHSTMKDSYLRVWKSTDQEIRDTYGKHYLLSYVNFLHFFEKFVIAKDSYLVNQDVLEAMTNSDPDLDYTSISFLSGLSVWLISYILPADFEDIVTRIVDWYIIPNFHRFYQTDNLDIDLDNDLDSNRNQEGNKQKIAG